MTSLFAKELKKIRVDKGYTQNDLASILGVPLSKISKIESTTGKIDTSFLNSLFQSNVCSSERARELEELMYLHNGEFTCKLGGLERNKVMLLVSFAASIRKLDSGELNVIKLIMDKYI